MERSYRSSRRRLPFSFFLFLRLRENVEAWADWRKHGHTDDVDEEEVVEEDGAETKEEEEGEG